MKSAITRPTNLCRRCAQSSLVVKRRCHVTTGPTCQGFLKHPRKRRSHLPDRPARTRFAPSPTGYLHLGGLRTALYNYLLAKATGGQFLVRIEDTDQLRTVSDAEESLYRDLAWVGLTWDEGPDVGGPVGPYKQSNRLSIYEKYADQLLKSGSAFRCFCTPEAILKHQQYCRDTNQPMTYPGTCQGLSREEVEEQVASGKPHTIRFNSRDAAPVPVLRDLVYGNLKMTEPRDSKILIKSDGFPTYHFANVVDDHLMGITHVIRGAEWLITTPFHASLYQAFGWDLPKFSHVCLLTDANRQKLSKRNHDIGVASYRQRGILPTALLNFCVVAGWHPGKGSEVMTLSDMVERFSFKFTKGDAIVDFGKLSFFQNSHIVLASAANPPQKDLLDVPFTVPVLALITEYTQKREIFVPKDEPAPMKNAPQKPLAPLLLDELIVREDDMESHVLNILREDGQPFQTPARFLHRHAYLIWRIPESKLRWEWERLCEKFVRIYEVIDGRGKMKEEGSEKGPACDEIGIMEVVTSIKEKLEALPDEAWVIGSEKSITTDIIRPIVMKYDFIEPGTHPNPKGLKLGWHVLRWVLNGCAEGLPIGQILLLLGKQESLRRFETAQDVAFCPKT